MWTFTSLAAAGGGVTGAASRLGSTPDTPDVTVGDGDLPNALYATSPATDTITSAPPRASATPIDEREPAGRISDAAPESVVWVRLGAGKLAEAGAENDADAWPPCASIAWRNSSIDWKRRLRSFS